jgi:hypothetical protein
MIRMEMENSAAKLLFLRYALPSTVGRAGELGSCSGDLITASKADPALVQQVFRGVLPDLDIRSNFRVASAWCELIAKEMRRESIDEDAIRAYFWFVHNAVIDKRVDLGENFDHASCRMRLGTIIRVDAEKKIATVVTSEGEILCDTSFINDAAKGDRVATHFNYITEKVSPELERRMNSLSGELDGLYRKLDTPPRTGDRKMKIGV